MELYPHAGRKAAEDTETVGNLVRSGLEVSLSGAERSVSRQRMACCRGFIKEPVMSTLFLSGRRRVKGSQREVLKPPEVSHEAVPPSLGPRWRVEHIIVRTSRKLELRERTAQEDPENSLDAFLPSSLTS